MLTKLLWLVGSQSLPWLGALSHLHWLQSKVSLMALSSFGLRRMTYSGRLLLKVLIPPRSRRCSSENIHLIEDVGMFFGFFGVIAKTWKLELYLITSRWRANERLLDHTDTVANRRFQPFGGSSESQQPIKTSTGEWHVAIFWGKRADLLDD